MMKIAFYRASAGNMFDKAINLWTGMYGYSHVELVFSDGVSFSASSRDNLVRFARINFVPDRWEFVELPLFNKIDEAKIRAQAENLAGRKYDWKGIFLWMFLPLKKQDNDRWWCSEIVSFLLKESNYRVHPNKMAKQWKVARQPWHISISFMK